MEVTTVRAYRIRAEEYAICPNCGFAMEREYQNYCDYCGQHLCWNQFRRGQFIYQHPQYPVPESSAISPGSGNDAALPFSLHGEHNMS